MLFPGISGTTRRLIGVLTLVPIVAAICYDVQIASVMIFLLVCGMVYEFVEMAEMPYLAKIVVAVSIITQALPYWIIELDLFWHVIFGSFSFGITLIYQKLLEAVFALALSLCFCFTAVLLHKPDGNWLILMLAGVVAACDTAAYFVGRFIGGPKLASSISPNKTISGSIAGVVASMVTMTLISSIIGINLLVALTMGLAIAVLSQIGDLLESALKRRANVKDSGTVLIGHGGLLDRFDGYLFTIPVFYISLF